MRRIKLVLAALVVMVAAFAAFSGPAMAADRDDHWNWRNNHNNSCSWDWDNCYYGNNYYNNNTYSYWPWWYGYTSYYPWWLYGYNTWYW